MKTYIAIVERCPDTALYVRYIPGFPSAHSQGETLNELKDNLKDVIEMLLEEGEPTSLLNLFEHKILLLLDNGKYPILKPKEVT